MVEFEPPKRKALSDAELHRAVTLLGPSAEGLVASEQLISEQTILRQQDSEALASWIQQMQRDGSAQAKAALNRIIVDVLPPNLEPTTPTDSPPVTEAEKAVFTSELPRIDRRQRSRSSEIIRKLIPGLASWILIALTNSLIATWLELSILESIFSFTSGLLLSSGMLLLLKTHSLHPLLRSAAVFGGWGVYFGAGLAMALSALVLLEGAIHVAPRDLLVQLTGLYRTDLLAVGATVLVISQLLPRFLFWWVLLSVGLGILIFHLLGPTVSEQAGWFAYAPNSGETFAVSLNYAIAWDQVLWGALAVALITTMMFAFGMPHAPTRPWSFSLQIPLGIGLSTALAFSQLTNLTVILILGLGFLSIALSGRDLSANVLGRFAGLAFLIPVIAAPVLEWVNGPAVAVLVCLIVMLFGDQLVRRTPLHIPSLETSYGFYGSFQPITWLGLVVAAPLGVLQVQELLLPSTTFTQHELALIFGLVIGLIFALIRMGSIRSQDREIRNVEIRNMNLDNLLGL